jgi:hypothetical protein
MSSISIQHGDIETIGIIAVDFSGALLPGKTDLKVKIRRRSDGGYFDWSDDTFKPGVLVAQMLQALQQVSATYSPGEYKLSTATHINGFNTSLITNPVNEDTYFIIVIQDGGTDVANVPQFGEIRVEKFVITDHTPIVF